MLKQTPWEFAKYWMDAVNFKQNRMHDLATSSTWQLWQMVHYLTQNNTFREQFFESIKSPDKATTANRWWNKYWLQSFVCMFSLVSHSNLKMWKSCNISRKTAFSSWPHSKLIVLLCGGRMGKKKHSSHEHPWSALTYYVSHRNFP